MENGSHRPIRFGDFSLDIARRLLVRNSENVALNAKAFDLLATLVENRGNIVSKDQLLDTVWEGQFVEENNLTVHMSALRKALGETKGNHQFIATIPGKGYKFVGELLSEETDLIIETRKIERITIDEEIVARPTLPGAQRDLYTRFWLPAVIVLAIAAVGYWVWTRNVQTVAPISSIAVMPFTYEGSNTDSEYLTDGMTESLINNLSQLPQLTVKARNSVFHYKGKEIDPKKIRAELGVQAVLLGRMIERGEQFILSLELIDAATNDHLWGEQYTRQKSELAVLQNDLAREVATKLRQKLTKGDAQQKGQTANAEAYQLYLKGRFLWNKRKHEESMKALNLFEQAIALDPRFALAHAAIGDVYTVDAFRGSEEEKNIKGRGAALKALEIEPDLAEALTVLAKIEWNAFNREEAERYFKRAIELNPNYASARQWHAEFLIQQVRTDEAIAEIKRALELDPLSPIINSDAVFIFMMARQNDLAIEHANKMLELDPNWRRAYTWRGAAYEAKGDYAAAIADFERANEFGDKTAEEKERNRLLWKQTRESLARSGERGYWESSLEIAKREPEQDQYMLAVLYIKVGDRENALSSLEKAFEGKNEQINIMKVEPYFDSLQSEPRFQTLLKKIGLSS